MNAELNAGSPISDDACRIPLPAAATGDDILRRAVNAYCRVSRRAALIAAKQEVLRQYDVYGMQEAVNICFWGRSGSTLLASYLDGHSGLLSLPLNCSQCIYPFLDEYQNLSVWEQLIVYPIYSAKNGLEASFFEGDYAIEAEDYYAALESLFISLKQRSDHSADGSVRFIQLLYVAYAVARERRPASPRPLIVYCQHWTDEALARRFVADFPRARFIHTIRDPISCIDSWFDRQLDMQLFSMSYRPAETNRYLSPAVETLKTLLAWDRAHEAAAARTCAIRFEDLHLNPEATMRRLAAWLEISFEPCLLESSYNGRPYVFKSGTRSWTGPLPANARRRSAHLSCLDRALLYALLRQNFRVWNYPSPSAFQRRWLSFCVIALLWLLPTKMELTTARMVLLSQALPSLRRGRIRFALGALPFLVLRRLRVMLLVAMEARSRLFGRREVLRLL